MLTCLPQAICPAHLSITPSFPLNLRGMKGGYITDAMTKSIGTDFFWAYYQENDKYCLFFPSIFVTPTVGK
jgi:hypothetical protein